MSRPLEPASKNLEVAIIGAGSCGVVCAIALQKYGIKAHVYESTAKFGEIGAGFALNASGLRVLEQIGVLPDVLAKIGYPGKFEYALHWRHGTGDLDSIYKYPQTPEGVLIGVQRSTFLDSIVQFLDPACCHFKKRCISITPASESNPRCTIHFADGTTAETHVVLLASGINCSVRNVVAGEHETNFVTYANKYCYRGLVYKSALQAAGVTINLSECPVAFVGQDKNVVMYPINNGAVLNVIAYVTDYSKPFGDIKLPQGQPMSVPATTEEMLADYSDFGPEFHKILSCLTKPNKWYLTVIHPLLDTYAKGRVALLGDAAHAMLPHIGAGVGQSLEDAFLIAQLIAHPETTLDNVESVLKVYDEVRRPRSQKIWEQTALAGMVYEGHGEHGLTTEGIIEDVFGILDDSVHHPVDADMKSSVRRLQELGIYH